MKTAINSQAVTTAINEAAKYGDDARFQASFFDLEELGWDFSDLYDSMERAQNISYDEAVEFAQKNWIVEITVRPDEDSETPETFYTVQDRPFYGNRSGDAQITGDDAKTIEDLHALAAAHQLEIL